MTLIFTCIFVFNMGLLLALVGEARSPVFRNFAGGALNPLIIFVVIMLLFNIDFVIVFNDPAIEFLETRTSLASYTVLNAYCVYTLITLGAAVGFRAAIWSMKRTQPVIRPVLIDDGRRWSEEWVGAVIIFIAIMSFSLAVLVPLMRNGDGGLSFQVNSRQNVFPAIATWFLPNALALLLAYMPRPISALGFAITMSCAALLVGAGGARVMPLVCLLAFAVAYAHSKRISASWYVPALPALGLFLTGARYTFRETEQYGSFLDYLSQKGGLFHLLFMGEEVSFAKMFSALYDFTHSISISPPISLFALLAAPIPRSIFPQKPMGASAFFTELVSPYRWEWTKSESLVTGYGDLYWQFGAIGAVVVTSVLAFLWLLLCIRLIHNSREKTVVWLPLLLWGLYTFIRADIFNVGLLLWPGLLVIAAHRCLSVGLKAISTIRQANTVSP